MRPVLTAAILLAMQQPTASASAREVQIIEYYGDSTVWGYQAETGKRVTRTAPIVFAESLPEPSKFDVRNEGVNGSTACELLEGKDGMHPPWQKQMSSSKARYVIINFGINDQWKHDLDTYSRCLRSLARVARADGKTIVFETPNPTRDSGPDGLDVYVDAMRRVALAESLRIIDQYSYLGGLLGKKSPYAFCPDGLHPSADVYEMKGRFAARMFAKYFLLK